MAFGVERLDELGEKVQSVLEMTPPQGMLDKIRALGKLKSLADSRPQLRAQRAVPGDRARPARPGPAADHDLLAEATAARSSRCPRCSRSDPRTGMRNVGMYRIQKLRLGDGRAALADPQGRGRRLAGDGRADGGRGRHRPRPDHRLLGLCAAAQARRRADARRLPARRAGGAGAREDRRPRGAGARRDRARGLRREGRAARRGAVRRPHRLLHAGRAVPGAARRPA